MRRFPPPWTVEALESGFKIVDANKQAIAYVYGHADPARCPDGEWLRHPASIEKYNLKA